jgi:F0F1-type ATP synthase membrane subunit b/b'
MEAVRQSWTDDRLDDLSRHMDKRFDRVEGDIRELRAETRETGSALQKELTGTKDSLQDEISATRHSLGREIGATRDSLQREIGATRDSLQREIGAAKDSMQDQLLTMQRTMIQVGGGLIAANLTLMAAVLGLMVTQL